MSYKDLYNKMNITHELLVNRYMLSVLLTNVFNLIEILQANNKTTKSLLDIDTKKKLDKDIKLINKIDFNNFSITNKQYQALLNIYDAEIVTNACVILDWIIMCSGWKD